MIFLLIFKDLIIRGGENIYPTEVEQFLYKHPKVQDVQVNVLVLICCRDFEKIFTLLGS